MTTAPTADYNGNNSGRIYVHDGATGAELWQADGAAGWRLGNDAIGAGDWNDDGRADVIAGAPAIGAGQAVIYDGLNGDVIHTFFGENGGDQFGSRVFGAGDFDGDGSDDVIIGAPFHDSAGNNAGRAYVYSGADRSLIGRFPGSSRTA